MGLLVIDIAPDSVTSIVNGLSRRVYITQEVVDTSGGLMQKHSNVGDVQVYVSLLFSCWRMGANGGDWVLDSAMPTPSRTHSWATVSRRLQILQVIVGWRAAWPTCLLRTMILSVADRR